MLMPLLRTPLYFTINRAHVHGNPVLYHSVRKRPLVPAKLLYVPLVLLLPFATPRTPDAFPGPINRRGGRRGQSPAAFFRTSHSLSPPLLLLLLLLPLHLVGLQSTAVAAPDTDQDDGAKYSIARVQDGTITSSRWLVVDLPDVTIDADNVGDDRAGEGGENGREGEEEEASVPLDEEASEAGGAVGAVQGGAAGELLTPEDSAEALLADGGPRCFFGDAEEPSQEGGSSKERLLCLPTLFFLGVSKCGESV